MLIKENSISFLLKHYINNSNFYKIKVDSSKSNDIIKSVDLWNTNFKDELSKILYTKQSSELKWVFNSGILLDRIEDFNEYFSSYIDIDEEILIKNFDLIFETIQSSEMNSILKINTTQMAINSINKVYINEISFLNDTGGVIAKIRDGVWKYSGKLDEYDKNIEVLNDLIVNSLYKIILSNHGDVIKSNETSVFIERLISFLLDEISFSLLCNCYLLPLEYKKLKKFSNRLHMLSITSGDTIDIVKFINLYNICLTNEKIEIIADGRIHDESEEREFPSISIKGDSFLRLFFTFYSLYIFINN